MFQLPDAPEGGDVALVMHTSGTAGTATAVELTYGNIRANARGLAQAMGLSDDERWLSPLPLAHVGGLMVVLRSTLMATTAVLLPPPFDEQADARSCATAASRSSRSCPTQLQRLLDAGATPGPGAAARAARRRADAARAARARPRRGLPGLPELRADAGLLDGDRRRAG